MATDEPNLKFGAGNNTGFTSTGISAYDDLRPVPVVRELIQNALDAGQEAGESKTQVRFHLYRVPISQIPGIEAYKDAFHKAVKYHGDRGTGKLSGQAKTIADRIQRALNREHIDVLSVTDNGVGLNENRMNSLLSDGVSNKGSRRASGTYGNGHMTAVPASDLRYILYGGVTKDGVKIGSGHAILASHYKHGQEQVCSADGYYIRRFNATETSQYDYATGKDVPDLICRDLDRVWSDYGHGTAVLITAFNNFREEDPLWKIIAPGAAANFFVALQEQKLEIIIEDSRPGGEVGSITLDDKNLEDVIAENKEKKREPGFISGSAAFAGYKAYSRGKLHKIQISNGNIMAYIHQGMSDGRPRIDLCRNGMWITNDLPLTRGKFVDRAPFHALLTLEPESGGQFYDLIRHAEGPLHDSLSLKRLEKGQKEQCSESLREIISWIRDNTIEINSDSYTIPDFLNIDFGGEAGSGGVSKPAFWGSPVTVTSRSARASDFTTKTTQGESGNPQDSPGGNNQPPNADRSRRRPSLAAIFQAASRPIGPNRYRVIVNCLRDCSDAELRLVPDEAIDATCDRPNQDPYFPVTLSDVRINGESADAGNLRSIDNRTVGVRLGKISKGTILEIEADCLPEEDFFNLPQPALRIELFKSMDMELPTNPDNAKNVRVTE